MRCHAGLHAIPLYLSEQNASVLPLLQSTPSGNHGVDDAGGLPHRSHPLEEDHVIHEAKEADHENEHWYTLICKVYLGAAQEGGE